VSVEGKEQKGADDTRFSTGLKRNVYVAVLLTFCILFARAELQSSLALTISEVYIPEPRALCDDSSQSS
jgi:hypothetical protein